MSNVKPVSFNSGGNSIAEQLIEYAEEVRAKPYIRTVILVVDNGGDADVLTFGYLPRLSDTLGLLDFASRSLYDGSTNG